MTIIRAQVVLQRKSELPRDVVVNTWHFHVGLDPATADLTAIRDALRTFYQALPAANIIGPQYSVTTGAHRIKQYVIADATPAPNGVDFNVPRKSGPPVRDDDLPLAGGNANGLPGEVAIALSFRGLLDNVPEYDGGNRPAQRRRGRVFLGNIAAGALAVNATTGEQEITSTARTAILTAATTMRSTLSSLTNPVVHGVWSKKNGIFYPTSVYHIDNAPDTQRRRGMKATQRTISAVQAPVALGA